MKVLLDGHTLLWMSGEPGKLSAAARTVVENSENELLLSAVTAWELVIKESLKKLSSPKKVLAIISQAEREFSMARLPITDSHLSRLSKLAFHHRDPFDRLLAAQALAEKISLVSCDQAFDMYKVSRIWD